MLQTRREVLAENDPQLLTAMHRLARSFAMQLQYHKAEELLLKVVQYRNVTPGPKHEETLRAMQDMGEVLFDEGRWEEADKLLDQVWQTSKLS